VRIRNGCNRVVSAYARYVAVGTVVGGITVAMRELFSAVLPADTPAYYAASVLLAYTVGIVLSYYGHHSFTFGGQRIASVSLYRLSLFALIALLGLVIAAALSIAIRYGLRIDHFLGRYGAGFAFALAALGASLLTYILNTLYTFSAGHSEGHPGEAAHRSGERQAFRSLPTTPARDSARDLSFGD
jgi:putative flippase GtrA